MDEINVSIIVPVYNMQSYLEACLDSLVHQTLQKIEIIIIDDGSKDNSAQIIKEYAERYPDIIRALHKENGGQATARNMGIRESKGEYIGFVDSDDVVETNMYAEMYQLAKQKNCDLVECNYRFVKALENGEKELKTYGYVRNYKSKEDMFHNPLVSPWNKLYRGELLRDNDILFPEGYIYEDTSFFIKAIPYVETWDFIDQPYVIHYLRQNSTMTGSKSAKVSNIFPVLKDIIDFYSEKFIYEKYKAELELFITRILLCSSLKRVACVREKNLRKELQESTLDFLEEYFPEYRKNRYLQKGKLAFYMKSINRLTVEPICMGIYTSELLARRKGER